MNYEKLEIKYSSIKIYFSFIVSNLIFLSIYLISYINADTFNYEILLKIIYSMIPSAFLFLILLKIIFYEKVIVNDLYIKQYCYFKHTTIYWDKIKNIEYKSKGGDPDYRQAGITNDKIIIKDEYNKIIFNTHYDNFINFEEKISKMLDEKLNFKYDLLKNKSFENSSTIQHFHKEDIPEIFITIIYFGVSLFLTFFFAGKMNI